MASALGSTAESDLRREERLYWAVETLDWCCELAKRVYHLGRPVFVDSGSTASLRGTSTGKPLFEFSRRFFDGLGNHELVFVLLHEALHHALCHIERREDRQPAIWNVACDLVVNAFLLERVGFKRATDPAFHRFLASAITFENMPLVPPGSRLIVTAEAVYRLLERAPQQMLAKGASLLACDEHTWCSGDADEAGQAEQMGELGGEMRRILRESLSDWGDQPVGELRAIGEERHPVTFRWDLVLASRIASCIKLAIEQRWAPPNRKIAWLYPRVLLPAEHEIEKMQSSLLLAIDASGSIPRHILDRLLEIAGGAPRDRLTLAAVSFDTNVYPFDIAARLPGIRGGGGTSFDAIEQFALSLRRYPDLVVVLTDGHAPRPAVRHPDRWFWLITPTGTSAHVEGVGRYCRIEDLVLNHPGGHP